MSAGVYKIVCKPTGEVYVGSAAKSFRTRRKRHWTDLRRGVHHNFKLQRAWKTYGESEFAFEPVLVCRAEDAVMYEQKVIDAFQPQLNVAVVAGSLLGYAHTAEAKAKIAKYPRTREARMLQSQARSVGRKVPTREFEWSVDRVNARRKLTEEDIKAIRAEYSEKRASMRELGRRYGVDHHTISDICHRVTWKHVA